MQLVLWLIGLVAAATTTIAAPLQPTFSNCESYYNTAPGVNRLNVTNIYADLVPGYRARQLGLQGEGVDVLRVDLIGNVGSEVVGYDIGTNKLATLFTDTTVGGISVYRSTSWVCNSLFPPTLPTPYFPFNTTYCPLPAGPFGMNLSIPLYRSYALTTLSTQVRVVDTSLSANTISCVNISFTPYDKHGWYYDLFLWLPVALVVGFWVTSWGARFAAGWVVGSGVAEYGTKDQQHGEMRRRELDRAGRREATLRKWGTMIVSGISGERLSVSSGLLRFATPGLRDIMHHIQFCTILVMIAVSWPHFTYPIVSRLAWADLLWNTTIAAGESVPHVTTYPTNSSLHPTFINQMSTELYPLYLDTDTFNPLLSLGNAAPGMESFAAAVGLRPQDLFGTCLAIFLVIAAAIVLISVAIWVIHAIAEAYTTDRSRALAVSAGGKRSSYGSSAALSLSTEKATDPKSAPPTPGWGAEREQDQLPIATSQSQLNLTSRTRGPSSFRRTWWRFRPKGEAGAFHAAALYGNLLRLILIFHLPITTFSIYQLVLGSRASIVSRVFAALAFVFLSILIPAGIMWKVHKTPGGKLYDATRTLLAMGTMYNHYVVDKQLFRTAPLSVSLITGIAVGAGQASGIAQAVIVVILELVMLVLPAVWYPWGEGASMGAPSVFLSVIRVVSALLVMLLSPAFSMTETTQVWLAYAVLILNALAFLFFLFMLLTKIVEGLIRLFGGVHFDESTHPLDGGIFAAIADLDCLNGVMGGKAAARKRRKRGSRQLQRNVSAAAGLTTQQMLDKHSQMIPRQSPGSPVYEIAYPRMSEGYFPAYQPPLGPPPMERHSSDSRYGEEGGGGGNIMDAWRTKSNEGYKPPGTYAPTLGSPTRLYPPGSPEEEGGPSGSFRGGGGMANPYDTPNQGQGLSEFGRSRSPPVIRVSHATMPVRPPHQREYSSPVVVDSYDPSTPGVSTDSGHGLGSGRAQNGAYSTFPSAGGNKRHSGTSNLDIVTHVPLRSADLPIPKRRSLNDLKHEADSSASEHDGSIGKKGKKKQRSWFSRTAGAEEDTADETEESDDEPGPSRRRRGKGRSAPRTSRADVLPVTAYADERAIESARNEKDKSASGWRGKLGLGNRRKSMNDEEERIRDENKARKDALAAESGALFAGVESPSRRQTAKQRTPASSSGLTSGPGEGKKGFVVNRKSHASVAGPSRQSGSAILTSATGGGGSGIQREAVIPLLPLGSRSNVTSPTASSRRGTDGLPLSPSASSSLNEEGQTFHVKRLGKPRLRPNPVVPDIIPSSTATSPQVDLLSTNTSGTMSKVSYPPARPAAVGAGGEEGKKSFRVIRHTPTSSTSARPQPSPASARETGSYQASTAGPDSSKRSFVVKRPTPSTPPQSLTPRTSTPTAASVPVDTGYSHDAFIPYVPPTDLHLPSISPPSSPRQQGSSSPILTSWPRRPSSEISRQVSPERPLRDPRRQSQESGVRPFSVDSVGKAV